MLFINCVSWFIVLSVSLFISKVQRMTTFNTKTETDKANARNSSYWHCLTSHIFPIILICCKIESWDICILSGFWGFKLGKVLISNMPDRQWFTVLIHNPWWTILENRKKFCIFDFGRRRNRFIPRCCKANIGVSVYTSRGCSVKVTIEAPFLCHKILLPG